MEKELEGSATMSSFPVQRSTVRPPLLNGCQLEIDSTHYDNVLTFDLGNGRQWRKRIYPRQGYPDKLLRWSTAEEILSFLVSFDSHGSWMSHHVPQRPPSGTIVFYDRTKTKKYRDDGYDWKKRKSLSNIVREDRMRLKVGGYQLLYGCYAHSSSNPNLHRRTYWLIHNPNFIMVHYLEVAPSNLTQLRSTPGLGPLEPVDTPSDWSMVTISDPNLCALIEMVKADEVDMSTESMFTQLSLILNNNLEQATSLEEALISNNAGLPVNMYQDTRSKKSVKVDLPQTTPSPQSSDKSDSAGQNHLVESMQKAPHLVVCQSEHGAMSCFMTFPPPSRTSDASMFPPGTKLPLPSLGQSVQLSLYSPLKSTIDTDKRKRKGKEKAGHGQEKQSGSRVLGVLSQILPFMKKQAASTNASHEPQNSDQNSPKTVSEIAHHSSSSGQFYVPELSNHSSSDGDSNLTPASHGTPSMPADNDSLTLDLNADSVQQLLQLSPDVSATQATVMDPETMDTTQPCSPFTQMINSLNSPEQSIQQSLPMHSNSTTEPIISHQATFSLEPSFSSSSVDEFNPHTTPFQSQTHPSMHSNTHQYNIQHSVSNSTPHNQHELFPRPPNHLSTNEYGNHSSLHTDFSTQLYALPQTDSSTETTLFPGSLVPAQEYQDLESFMNTIVADGETESWSQMLPQDSQQPPATPTVTTERLSSNSLGVFDTQSLNLPNSPSSSHQDHVPTSHHLSLPDLTLSDTTLHPSTSDDVDVWAQFYSDHNHPSTQSTSARSSSCLSSGPLQDIPEGFQMELGEAPPALHQLDVYDYRTGGSSIPSSPGQASVSSRSSISAYEMFETASPSVLELCEMLSESPNVQQNDFSHLTLSDSEQQQLFRAAKTIQNAFRKYKDRRQARSQQKRAALMIEKYYKQYREAKKQQDHAARKIQQQYRDYRRSRDLNRAALFVQQMYRYHRNKRGSIFPPKSTNN